MHEAMIVDAARDLSGYVREAAIECLRKFEVADRERHLTTALAMLDDTFWRVSHTALQFLGELPRARHLLLPHREAISRMLREYTCCVRSTLTCTAVC